MYGLPPPTTERRKLMSDQILKDVEIWKSRVKEAKGWPSAYYAAKQLANCVAAANSQGHNIVNPYPIKRGNYGEINEE